MLGIKGSANDLGVRVFEDGINTQKFAFRDLETVLKYILLLTNTLQRHCGHIFMIQERSCYSLCGSVVRNDNGLIEPGVFVGQS